MRPAPLFPSPVASLAALAAELGQNKRQILDRLELDARIIGAESLPWAWNLATDPAGRREIRILRPALLCANLATLAEVLPLLFAPRLHPGLSPALRREARHITGTQFQRALACGPDLVADLVSTGQLPLLAARSVTTGRNASPVLAASGVFWFLESRRL